MASPNHIPGIGHRTAEAADAAAWPNGGILIQSLPPTLDVHQLAGLLHRAPSTIRSDRTRAPHRVPPTVETHGTRGLLWATPTVLNWMSTPPDPDHCHAVRRRPGRPRKAEQMASQRRDHGGEP